MITLEISPEVVPPTQNPPLEMNTQTVEDNWECTVIRSEAGDVLGTARQAPNPMFSVRFFQGKGGFCAVVESPQLVYFGLPGSKIALPDTVVEVPGELIAGKPKEMITPLTKSPVQTLTHQAMILGAGMATRFEPISGDTTGYPKPGVPFVGEDSVITAIAKHLAQHGFTHLLVNTFYKPQSLKRQLAEVQGITVDFIDEDAPSGTAGGLAKAIEQGLVDMEKPILIIQGDAITDCDLSYLMEAHFYHHAMVSIGGQIVPDKDVHKFGIIETDCSGGDGQSGNITSFKEKPALADAGSCRFANAGFYVLAPEAYPVFMDAWRNKPEGKLYDYANDFFPAVLAARNTGQVTNERGRVLGFWAQALGGYWSDIGNPAQYVEAVRDAYNQRLHVGLPPNPEDYYAGDIIYWPGAKALATQDQAQLSGNVVVAHRFSG